MIKIMIVDDMPVFRQYLLNCIEWNAYGFEVCCEAKNGKDALAKFEEFYPDIVLTDITMPYIDGLELSERLLKDYPDISVVLITAHSEFEYARKALKLGVCDYIVKPFEKEELLLTLLKLQDNINKLLEMEKEKDRIKYEKREMALRKLIYYDRASLNPMVVQMLRSMNIVFNTEYFLVCTIKIEKYDNTNTVEDILKWEDIILNMLKTMIIIDGKTKIFKDFEGNIVTILNFKTKKKLLEYKGYEFEDLIKIIKQHLNFDVTVGISDYCYHIKSIKDAYYQTIQALSNQYTNNKNKIFDYKKIGDVGTSSFYSWDIIDSINTNLEVLNYKNIEKTIVRELDFAKHNVKNELNEMMYMSLLSLLLSFIVKIGRSIENILGPKFNPYNLLRENASHKDKKEFILKCYAKVIDYQKKNMDTKSYVIAENAKKYIEDNYSNSNLAIEDISKHLLLNQTYLRRMFKSEVNMTVTEFLTKTRMEKAKQLIIEEEYKLSAIAEMVGYSDPSYFSKCFKKYYGVSPSTIKINN